MDNNELLNVAKGVVSASDVLSREGYWKIVPENKRDAELKRKAVRGWLHKIVKYIKMNKEVPDHFEDAKILLAMYEEQMKPNLGIKMDMFAWKWDLHPKDHTKIILREEWIKSGGGFDPDFGTCAPNAFTKDGTG